MPSKFRKTVTLSKESGYIWLSKTQHFILILNPLKSFAKKIHAKSVINEKVIENGVFEFITLYSSIFAWTFLLCFLTDSKSASSSAFFDSHIECLQKILLILALYANFEVKETKKALFCLKITLGIHFRSGRSVFDHCWNEVLDSTLPFMLNNKKKTLNFSHF